MRECPIILVNYQMGWTRLMYKLFAFEMLSEVFKNCNSWNANESEKIKQFIKIYKNKLNVSQKNLIKFRVRKAKNDYKTCLLDSFGDRYWHEIERGEDIYPDVEFDQKTYEIWTKGVRLRKSVKILYESTTTGMMTRIVDPYKTETPYGRGFCHIKNEMRKFRFDRIIEIELTNDSFIKPKKWKDKL